jgi:hypothetical protein
MRMISSLSGIALIAFGCTSAPSPTPKPADQRVAKSVFTDSALRAALCVPAKSGEDWRKVCTPKDQSVRIR